MSDVLRALPDAYRRGEHAGITSVCSAHPIVIEAALRHALESDTPALIEATCNQVNQDGGYTGMTPRDFRRFVEGIAEKVEFDTSKIVFGGDHLGPNPWKSLPAQQAMAKAEAMIAAFAEAGFAKLHLDTSMGCAGESEALEDDITARRAAQLAAIAERHKDAVEPVFVIGTEVPVPGGASHALDHIPPTHPQAVAKTWSVHSHAFRSRGLEAAFERVVAMVVQPGVEFGHTDIVHFDPDKAKPLSASLNDYPGIVFEAHSTDYQTEGGLRDLVSMGFSILKVGPWLTFALREALYKLDAIADILENKVPAGGLMAVMEATMLSRPDDWQNYYSGSHHDRWIQRHFSLSDRIRYYWPQPAASRAVDELMLRLGEKHVPPPLLHQFFPELGLRSKPAVASELLVDSIRRVLQIYTRATG